MDIPILGDAFAEKTAQLPNVGAEQKAQSPGLTCLRALPKESPSPCFQLSSQRIL